MKDKDEKVTEDKYNSKGKKDKPQIDKSVPTKKSKPSKSWSVGKYNFLGYGVGMKDTCKISLIIVSLFLLLKLIEILVL